MWTLSRMPWQCYGNGDRFTSPLCSVRAMGPKMWNAHEGACAFAVMNQARDVLIRCAGTALNSKLISSQKGLFAPMVVEALSLLDQQLLDLSLVRHQGRRRPWGTCRRDVVSDISYSPGNPHTFPTLKGCFVGRPFLHVRVCIVFRGRRRPSCTSREVFEQINWVNADPSEDWHPVAYSCS